MLTYFFMGGVVLVFTVLTVGVGAFFAGCKHFFSRSLVFLGELFSKK